MHIRTQRLAICKELKKGSCVTPQLAEIMFYDPPDDPVLNAVITVGQNITEGNNAPVIPNFRKYLSINTREAVECFTDDLKFSLHGCLRLAVSLVLLKRHPADKPEQFLHIGNNVV